MKIQENENKDLCSKCGGMCCKKCGCDYFVSDFENLNLDYLESILDKGRISIVACFDFSRLPNGKLINQPILYLRARNVDRGIIDLFSLKKTCASLEDDKCHYNWTERPSGGKSLIPSEAGCYSNIDRIEELNKWKPYQKLLHRIVKRRCGRSVYAELAINVENVLNDIVNGNLDGVSKIEIVDIKSMLPMLAEIYPNEFKNALNKNPNKTLVLNNQKKHI